MRTASRCFLATFVLASTGIVSGCHDPGPFTGPCAGKSSAEDKAYNDLALRLSEERLGMFPYPGTTDATPENVQAAIARFDEAKKAWVPTLPNECLRSHAIDWLSFYTREARYNLANRAQYEADEKNDDADRRSENDRVRDLREKLGL